jgi:hypothetical protein
MSACSCCLCLCLPELCSAGPTSSGVNFDDSKAFPAWLHKQPAHLLGSGSSLPHLASLPRRRRTRVLLWNEKHSSDWWSFCYTDSRHEIRKRVCIYGRYMLLFFDVTVGFISSFLFFCDIFHICLGFRVYISCPNMCSVAKSAREYAALYLRPRSLWNGFIPSDWFSNCCFLNSRKICYLEEYFLRKKLYPSVIVLWNSKDNVPFSQDLHRMLFCEPHESTPRRHPCLRLRILPSQQPVSDLRSGTLSVFVDDYANFPELLVCADCWWAVWTLRVLEVSHKLESRTPLRSLCCPCGIVIESYTDAVFPSVKWTPTLGRLEKLRALVCPLTCRTVCEAVSSMGQVE